MKKIDDKKEIKKEDDSVDQVKKFVIILFGVALICFFAYLFTAKFLVKEESNKKADVTIEYTSTDVGNIFNRPYDNYFVLAVDKTSKDSSYYEGIASTYSNESKSKKVYNLDLSLKVNKKYVGKSNRNAKNASEVSLTSPTLIEIKDGKIVNYYDTKESITNALK